MSRANCNCKPGKLSRRTDLAGAGVREGQQGRGQGGAEGETGQGQGADGWRGKAGEEEKTRGGWRGESRGEGEIGERVLVEEAEGRELRHDLASAAVHTFAFPGCDPSDNPTRCPAGFSPGEVADFGRFDLVLVQGQVRASTVRALLLIP